MNYKYATVLAFVPFIGGMRSFGRVNATPEELRAAFGSRFDLRVTCEPDAMGAYEVTVTRRAPGRRKARVPG